MEFALSSRTEMMRERLWEFMEQDVLPAEPILTEELAGVEDPFNFEPPIKENLKREAKHRGLWNLFLPDPELGAGLSNVEYAPLAEVTGWSPDLGPEAVNCSAPDTGNMELLHLFGNERQRESWLEPLLEGRIRSCFCMTEPGVASSDADNVQTRIIRDGEYYVVTGRKWWSSAAMRPTCKLLVVMGVSNPDAPAHQRHSIILIPKDTPGVQIVRSTSVFGYEHASIGGHAEIIFDHVRVPLDSLLGEQGQGFSMAQARLGPGRIHHCMRLLGMGERALQLMCTRSKDRTAFGKRLSDQGVIQEWIADSRIALEQARLLVFKTAWLMDTVGAKGARIEISAIKVAVPNVVQQVVDRAIQVHGGAGVSNDTPLARFFSEARYLRIGDGPDEVHRMSVAKRELRRYAVRES